MKIAAYIGGLAGLALLVTLFIRADLAAMLHIWRTAGWALLWLIPFRSLYFLLYALGWLYLLQPYDGEHRAGVAYIFWITTVREAIDRLLPVASVGGGVAGVRLLRWRGLAAVPVSATVIVEIMLTLVASYLYGVMGFFLLGANSTMGENEHGLLLAFLISLPVPVLSVLLLRYGSVFVRLQRFLSPLVGVSDLSESAAALDHELRASFARKRPLLAAGVLQFAALTSASFEIWFALKLFGHPVSVKAALILESLTQAVRHVAFIVPAGVGVQEAGLVLFGQALGISAEAALAVSMAKRLREVLCGLPALISWQLLEARRLRQQPMRNPC